jgi:hypothetical protein
VWTMPFLVSTVLIVMLVALLLIILLCCFGCTGAINPFEQLAKCTICRQCCDCSRVCGWWRNPKEVVEVELVKPPDKPPPIEPRSVDDRLAALESGRGRWDRGATPSRDQLLRWQQLAAEDADTEPARGRGSYVRRSHR